MFFRFSLYFYFPRFQFSVLAGWLVSVFSVYLFPISWLLPTLLELYCLCTIWVCFITVNVHEMLFKNQKHNTMTQNLKKGSARKPKAAKRKTNWLHFKLRCMHTSWLARFESCLQYVQPWFVCLVYNICLLPGRSHRSKTIRHWKRPKRQNLSWEHINWAAHSHLAAKTSAGDTL